MKITSAAGKLADPSILVNVPKLIAAYYELRPDPSDPRQRVVFGTSGHRRSVEGLLVGRLGVGVEENAGASFLRRDGNVWTTDKDGIIPWLLSADYARMGNIQARSITNSLTRAA